MERERNGGRTEWKKAERREMECRETEWRKKSTCRISERMQFPQMQSPYFRELGEMEKWGRSPGSSGKIKGVRKESTAGLCIEWMWDVLFPRRCPVCDRILRFRKEYICPECLEKIKFIQAPACMKCGKGLAEEEEYCYDCRRKKHLYIQGAAVFEYGSIASSVYRFKYGGRQEYAVFFGRSMALMLGERMRRWHVQALVPVPVHSSRLKKRGYNQASLLAKVISCYTGIPVRADIIVRQKKTVPQKELDEKQRQNNLKRAFKILQNDVKLDTIVIIDDIYTTGSTIDAMTAMLHAAGVGKVYYVALAIGNGL